MLPVNVAQSELTESMLVPLVNQFGLMQQQMFDQFQQAMAMMVQMFGTMHRDQMEVIRAELDRLRELTEEFHALKNELAERTREQAERPSQSSSSPPGAPSDSKPVPPAGPRSSAKPSSTSPEADKDRDTVLWLHQRIRALQQERESRWQKILKLVPGMSSS